MITREKHLQALKECQCRGRYFESIRQIKDQMVDLFPLDRSQLMLHTDFMDCLTQLEKSYQRRDLVEGES